VSIVEIKKEVNCELIGEETRWKIYSKALELRKRNQQLEALALMKTMDGVITKQVKSFLLLVKCVRIWRQWEEIEPWTFR
jgi:hypothetical protein